MVEGLLDLARPASARPEPGDLREAVRHAVDLVRARADAQGVPVRLSVPDTAVPATWDRGPFGMALVNLLWNALDAMPAGGNLTVTLEAIAGGAEIRVRDAGPGIHPEMSGRLFTPFSSTKPSGTGLGLATCRRVVEQHGGSIDARNAPDGGAIFTIHLPASEGPPDADVAGR
jgi:signal transduction histidine kinase